MEDVFSFLGIRVIKDLKKKRSKSTKWKKRSNRTKHPLNNILTSINEIEFSTNIFGELVSIGSFYEN